MAPYNRLFGDYSLLDAMAKRQQDMRKEIENLTIELLESKDQATWCDYFDQKYKFDIPSLRLGKIEADRKEVTIDVSRDPSRNPFRDPGPINVKGNEVIYFVPFDGDSSLFRGRPQRHQYNLPSGFVHEGELRLVYQRLDQDGSRAKQEFDNDLQTIQQHLVWAEETVRQFNLSIRAEAINLMAQRRIKLNRDREMEAGLGYPLRRREGAPHTYAVPDVRRKPAFAKAATAKERAPAAPEPALDMAEYEHILSVVSNMVAVMERSPHAFRGMDEPTLRDHFLVQLNGQYEGQATGETFNFEGKTDILVRVQGKNIFIAECKIWDGPESLKKAIDQLLGYTCWRDTKTALLIFNRGRQLSTVLDKIPGVVAAHPNFRRRVEYRSETGFRFVLHHRDDKERELTLTILVFEVPA